MVLRRLVVLVTTGAIAASIHAGSLDPPAGPVAPSMKTLREVEPRTPVGSTTTPGDASTVFRIDASGSYYLTNIMFAGAGRAGIIIDASNVTLDLNGFMVNGFAFPSGTGTNGIDIVSGRESVVVKNGSITGWGQNGIRATNAIGARFENLLITDCGTGGIVGGQRPTMLACTLANNGGTAFSNANGAVVENCLARGNGIGFSISAGSIRGCVADNNDGDGFVLSQSVAEGCMARGNSDDGFQVSGSMIFASLASSNGNDGIEVLSGSAVLQCTASGNGTAIANGAGIHVITDFLGNGNRIEGNTLWLNDIGIHVDGDHNAIMRNFSQLNAIGFDIDGTDNFLVQNVSSGGSPNYSLVGGNSVSPRISVVGSNGWAGIVDADHPWANFGF